MMNKNQEHDKKSYKEEQKLRIKKSNQLTEKEKERAKRRSIFWSFVLQELILSKWKQVTEGDLFSGLLLKR